MSRSKFLIVSRLALVVGVAAAATALGTAARASASTPVPSARRFHVALIRAEPKSNDTLSASPKAIRLWFSESIQAGATAMRLTNAQGSALPLGKVSVDATPKAPATATIPTTLAPGRYSLAWRTMAQDGHPAKGTLTFVVR